MTFWQDLEIRFEVAKAQLELSPGEFMIDNLSNVEDTKGNNGTIGVLIVTNLRLVWVNPNKPKQNLSVGWNCTRTLSIQSTVSKIRGQTQALFVDAFHKGTRYQFIFTHCVPGTPRLFSTVQAVHRAYDSSRLYRELKLRGSLFSEGKLNILPDEQLYEVIDSVWNLASDQGNLGTMYLTNIRIVWRANCTASFNVSIPYTRTSVIKVRKSKFGPALVVQTCASCGGFVLGFRVDPVDRLSNIAQMIQNLSKIANDSPLFGVSFSMEEAPPPLEELKVNAKSESVAFDEEFVFEKKNTYVVDGNASGCVYSNELGLAIQPIGEGQSLKEIWNIVS
ncbi:hypothetical protein P9112_006745 [Eukaryota sp. TZLM1-RC]